MATRKATTPQSTTGTVDIDVDTFPKPARQSTLMSPYVDDVQDICENNAGKRYPYEGEKEATALASQLRSLARRNHETALQVIILPKDTPTHPQGVYVRCGGEIKPKPRKNVEAEAPVAKPPAKRATNARKG